MVFIAILALHYNSNAQTELKAVQVNVFKNGTYFMLKEGDISLKKGIGKLALPEKPLLGTFWLSSLKDIRINNVVFKTDTIKKQKLART